MHGYELERATIYMYFVISIEICELQRFNIICCVLNRNYACITCLQYYVRASSSAAIVNLNRTIHCFIKNDLKVFIYVANGLRMILGKE